MVRDGIKPRQSHPSVLKLFRYSSLYSLALDQAFYTWQATQPDLDDFKTQPAPFNELIPLSLSSLQSRQLSHHEHITSCVLPVSPNRGNDYVVDEKLAVAGFHSLDHSCKNRLADMVGPVMHDGVHEVGSRSLDRLLSVEII